MDKDEEPEEVKEDPIGEEPEEKPEDLPDKTNRNFYILIGIVVLIVAAIIFVPRFFEKEVPAQTLEEIIEDTITNGERDDRRIYNGFVFINLDNLWYSQVQVENTIYSFGTRFNPYQVENITIIGNVDDSFRKAGEVYITFDPFEEQLTYINLAAAELSLNLVRAMGLKVTASCMEEHPDCAGREIITCDTTDKPVIALIRDNETKLVMDDNCMEIHGDGFDLLRPVDRVIFQAYGIMS